MRERKSVRVVSVEPQRDLVVRVEFTTGETRDIDLTRFMRGPIFEEIRQDRELFRQVRVDHELGTILWPNGADIDPDVLYGKAEPEWHTAPEVS
jgi:hypothetical protein